MIDAGVIGAQLKLNTGDFATKLAAADKSAQEFKGKMKKISDGMIKGGKVMTAALTVPIVAAGGFAVKAAIDFESAFAGVRKTVDASEKDFKILEQGIRDMAKELPQSAVEIAGVAEAAGQLGIETPNILEFTKTMTMLGDATNLSSEEAATSLARLANITGMSQTDFDRLGSSIVDLGNNLATTESEIVEMGLRLAGTGTQVNLTEAEIMGLAGAMSSVGINAEAGGSAMSRVMQKINSEVLGGGEKLKGFAKIAGMTSDEFTNTWKDKPIEALTEFIKGLDGVKQGGGDVAGVLKEMGLQSIQEIDTMLRLSGASETLTNAINISSEAWEENTALANEAEQRYATVESQMAIAKNQLKDVGITLGETLMPHILNAIDGIKDITEKFAALSPETQEIILKVGGLLAVAGPLLALGGTAIKGASLLVGGVKAVGGALGALKGASALGGVASAASAAGGGMTLLSGGLAATAAAAAPVVVGVAAIAAIGYETYKVLSEELIPEVQLFDETISKETVEAVQAGIDKFNELDETLTTIAMTGQTVTEEMKNGVVSNVSEMAEGIVAELEGKKQEAIDVFNEVYAETDALSEEDKAKKLEIIEQAYSKQQEEVKQGEDKIKEIYETASNEKRTITKEEQKAIDEIMKDMQKNTITAYSETAEETKTILELAEKGETTIAQRKAAAVIKNSAETRDKTIKDAEERHKKVVEAAEKLRADGTEKSKKLADEMIEESERQTKKIIEDAKEVHKKVVGEFEEQGKELIKNINTDNGEIMSAWDSLKKHFLDNPIVRKISTAIEDFNANHGIDKTMEIKQSPEFKSSLRNSIRNRYADGTDYHPGGLAIVGERGQELVELPRGSKVHTAERTKGLIGGATINNNITINATIREEADIRKIQGAIERSNQQAIRRLGGAVI